LSCNTNQESRACDEQNFVKLHHRRQKELPPLPIQFRQSFGDEKDAEKDAERAEKVKRVVLDKPVVQFFL
jgi:hypothetical protein